MNLFFSFQTARMFGVIIFLFAVISLFVYDQIANSVLKKRLLWLGVCGVLSCVILTIVIHIWSIPRGLSAQYFPNSTWTVNPSIELERYFEPDGTGRRTDRFIDFNPNDFNDRYPFSNKTFTVKWEGSLYLPNAGMQVSVDSNFDSWLFIDDFLADTRIVAPQALDIGTPQARPYLKKGWSFDEQSGKNHQLNFVWASNDDAHLLLGVKEIADYELSFHCSPFSFPDSSSQQVSVFLEGMPLGSVSLNKEWQTYTLSIPAAIIKKSGTGSLHVMFAFSRVRKPSNSIPGTGDMRELAVAFDRVELRQISPQPYSKMLQSGQIVKSGIHKITIKAKSSVKNPYIRLVGEVGNQSALHVIPEDWLFPCQIPSESILTPLMRERLFIKGLIGLEIILLVLFIAINIQAVLPYIRQWRCLFSSINVTVIGLCCVAFVLRFAFLLEMKKIDPAFYVLPVGTDHLFFLFSARGFWRGYWPWLSHAPLHFNPLVIIFLIVEQTLLGESVFISKFIVMLLSIFEVAMVYALTRRYFGSVVAIIAPCLYACNGVQIFFSTSLLIAPQVTFLNVLVLWYASRHAQNFSLKTAIVLGGLLGLLALGRPTFLLFMPCLFLWIFWRQQRSFMQKCGYCFVIWGICFLVISPITCVNYYSSPERPFVLIMDAGGWNFWIGNNLKASGAYSFDAQLLEQTHRHMKETGSSYFYEVWLFLKQYPKEFAALQWKKFLMFWCGYEISNLIPYYMFRAVSKVLGLPLINFVLLAPLGIIGMLFAFRRWQQLYLFYSYILVQIIINVGFLTLDRYRIPLLPIVSIFAAYTVYTLTQQVRRKQWVSVVIILLLFTILYLGLNYPKAAYSYKREHGTPMPFSRVVRYWDLFDRDIPN